MGALVLVIIGLAGVGFAGVGFAGVGFAVRAVMTGEIDVVFSRAGGWASLSTRFEREHQPLLFWIGTLFYALAGLALALFGAYRALMR